MQYIKVICAVAGRNDSDMLMAQLAGAGYSGFEETDTQLLAYIEQPDYDADELENLKQQLDFSYETELIPEQNWNALWESNFQPVVVDDFCTIRADFHSIAVTTPHDIVITPKMSFGTGHHATTQLMMLFMKDLEITGKTVLDFGTGTGVLAILAEMLGAKDVLAIDNDEWCVTNANENIVKNQCRNISVEQGSLEDVTMARKDIILANINRNILLEYMQLLYKKLNNSGVILMSGLLKDDKETTVQAATEAGFRFVKAGERLDWIALLFEKI